MNRDDARHLLRRMAFTTTPALEQQLTPLSSEAAVARLVQSARAVGDTPPPAFARTAWTNTALRLADTDAAADTAARTAQGRAHRADIEALRRWWIGLIVGGGSALRENLTLFLHDTLGSSSAAVEIPHALYACNALVRRACLGTIPALLEQLVLDPAMMIQVGLDEHFRVRVSDRPAKLILDRWTVGAGEYADSDVEELSRALTGWSLVAPAGREPVGRIDPSAPRASRRTGLSPRFDDGQFDAGPKVILGSKGAFGAVAAVGLLARHPATARRFGRLLVRHLGVEDPKESLARRVAAAYQSSGGSVEAMLREVARAPEFWAEPSRWTMVKSPAHLAAGACRALQLAAVPHAGISRWMTASGQTLFDTPDNGESSWPGQEDWITPPDRLAMRYQLPVVLAGQEPRSGIGPKAAGPPAPADLPLDARLRAAPDQSLAARLDPAPGVDLADIARQSASAANRAAEIVRRIIMTPNYQLA